MLSFEVKWCFSPHSTLLNSHFLWLWLVPSSLVMACSWFACQENTWALKENCLMAPGSEPREVTCSTFPCTSWAVQEALPCSCPTVRWVVIPGRPLHARLAHLLLKRGSALSVHWNKGHWLWRLIPINLLLPYRGLWLKACVCCCWEGAAGPMAQPGEADSCWTEQEKAQKHHHYK